MTFPRRACCKESWVQRYGDSCKLTPLPMPSKWKYEYRRSANWRKRKKGQREIRSIYHGMISVINGLDNGATYASQTVGAGKFDRVGQIANAQQAALEELLRDATLFAQIRRGSALSGDHGAGTQRQVATAKLVKNGTVEGGYVKMARQVPMVPLCAEALDEPKDDKTVDMLLSLDEEESFFYSAESHLLETAGKANCIMDGLERQYGFVGGSHFEYLKYWYRQGLPKNMWKWTLASRVKATAGFTAVSKKDA